MNGLQKRIKNNAHVIPSPSSNKKIVFNKISTSRRKKHLLQIFICELHNDLFSTILKGEFSGTRDINSAKVTFHFIITHTYTLA